MPYPLGVTQQQQERKAKREDDQRSLYPCQKNHFPISGVPFDRDLAGRNVEAQPPFEFSPHREGGDWENRKPKNDKPKRAFIMFKQTTGISAATGLAKEFLAEADMGNEFRYRAFQFVRIFGSLTQRSVRINVGRGESSLAKFPIECLARFFGKLLAFLSEMQEFVSGQILVVSHSGHSPRVNIMHGLMGHEPVFRNAGT